MDIPVLYISASRQIFVIKKPAKYQYTGYKTEIVNNNNNIQKILSLLEKSRHPLIAVGLTAARLEIGDELLSFLSDFRIPVVITPMAKGLIPETHPCYAGVLFHSLSDYLEDIFEKTDLVIGLGYDPVEFNYESWMPDVPLVHFDIRRTDMPSRKKFR